MISLTLKTASGSHSITKTSSVETTEECFKSKSAWMELWMAIRGSESAVASLEGAVPSGRVRWKEKGIGSAACFGAKRGSALPSAETVYIRALRPTHASSKVVDEQLESLSTGVGGQRDGRTDESAILVLELSDDCRCRR